MFMALSQAWGRAMSMCRSTIFSMSYGRPLSTYDYLTGVPIEAEGEMRMILNPPLAERARGGVYL